MALHVPIHHGGWHTRSLLYRFAEFGIGHFDSLLAAQPLFFLLVPSPLLSVHLLCCGNCRVSINEATGSDFVPQLWEWPGGLDQNSFQLWRLQLRPNR